MILILIGPPGAGKGTQAQQLAREFGFRHLSSGDLLRAERASGTDLGQRVAAYMDAGQLVPDDLIIEVILQRIFGDDRGPGVLLDGFPRTLPQARALDDALRRHASSVRRVLDIHVPDDVVLDRLTARRVCPQCDSVYHLTFRPPRVPGLCDRDGTPLIQRPDDQADVVARRLRHYHEMTEPLRDYYRRQGLLLTIDGNQPVDRVTQALRDAVRDLLAPPPASQRPPG